MMGVIKGKVQEELDSCRAADGYVECTWLGLRSAIIYVTNVE
jgi:hypothetical protein